MLCARPLVLTACAAVGLLVLCDCKRSRERDERSNAAGTTTVTSAELRDSVEAASHRLATARCEQEVSCAGLTRWTREANMTACLGRVKVETAKELEVCPRGIDQGGVVDCIAAIQRTSCDDPVSRLMQLEDCRTSKLCIGP
ncbi:MAG TPA: DUF6184 family natural product biosynthesis lipoprotein [Labilithrix sp.]|nr:DUF6184 family natural product biosynthesis lipoprotein [Labilithrix sp.]